MSREVTIGMSSEALLCWSPLLKFSLSYELKLLPGIEIFLQDAFSFAYKSIEIFLQDAFSFAYKSRLCSE